MLDPYVWKRTCTVPKEYGGIIPQSYLTGESNISNLSDFNFLIVFYCCYFFGIDFVLTELIKLNLKFLSILFDILYIVGIIYNTIYLKGYRYCSNPNILFKKLKKTSKIIE